MTIFTTFMGNYSHHAHPIPYICLYIASVGFYTPKIGKVINIIYVLLANTDWRSHMGIDANLYHLCIFSTNPQAHFLAASNRFVVISLGLLFVSSSRAISSAQPKTVNCLCSFHLMPRLYPLTAFCMIKSIAGRKRNGNNIKPRQMLVTMVKESVVPVFLITQQLELI